MSAEDIVNSGFSPVHNRAARLALHGFRNFVNFYFLNVLYD